ncbi:hypothetical protein QUF80_12670 [Desulfococcaceae bacterium HSG8]|nr:hypothetical protein [Desulfococcaceae bacterium HSG8]
MVTLKWYLLEISLTPVGVDKLAKPVYVQAKQNINIADTLFYAFTIYMVLSLVIGSLF